MIDSDITVDSMLLRAIAASIFHLILRYVCKRRGSCPARGTLYSLASIVMVGSSQGYSTAFPNVNCS